MEGVFNTFLQIFFSFFSLYAKLNSCCIYCSFSTLMNPIMTIFPYLLFTLVTFTMKTFNDFTHCLLFVSINVNQFVELLRASHNSHRMVSCSCIQNVRCKESFSKSWKRTLNQDLLNVHTRAHWDPSVCCGAAAAVL